MINTYKGEAKKYSSRLHCKTDLSNHLSASPTVKIIFYVLLILCSAF
jgi:hypothetical protein